MLMPPKPSTDTLRALRASIARDSLYQFVRQGWAVLEGGTALQDNWHIQAVCDHLQSHLEDDGPQNLLINIPPGTGKSLLAAVFAPAWVWLTRPGWRMVFASGTPSVVTRDSLRCRTLIKSDWYQNTFKPSWQIASDQDEKQLFANTAGGFRQGVGAGGAVTGVRANWLLTDDANDAKEIHSPAHREAVNERWWANAFHNRIADPRMSKRTVIGQRLHELDLAGHLLTREAGQWAHLCLRMELEPGDEKRTTWLGWTDPRPVGGLLFPERFPPEYLAAERLALGPSGYVGQMQQRPSSQEGNRFKREWWRFYTPSGGPAQTRPVGCSDLPSERLPAKFDRLIGTWDLSFKGTDKSDYVAGFVIGVTGARRWVRECYCERVGFTGAVEAIRRQWDQWRPHEILVEDKANGPAVLEHLGASVPRLLPVDPRGGKESRAAAIEPLVAAGNVYLPEGAEWVPALVDQFAAFPKGAHDDLVDALSQGLTHLEENSDVRRARALLGITK